MRVWLVSGVMLAASAGLGVACGGTGNLNFTGGTGGGSSSGSGGNTGLPCDVAMVLSDMCTSCHSNPPVAGAPMPLVTYADLAAPSKVDPSKTYAERAVIRMQDTTAPMPPKPAPAATAAQIKVISDWVAAGSPMGTCGGSNDPTFSGPSVCDSNSYYQPPPPPPGDNPDGAIDMYPGRPCVACHQNPTPVPPWTGDPAFDPVIAGTVFVEGHVIDACQPTPAQAADLTQAQVVITDANGKMLTLDVHSSGNFAARTSETAPTPQVAFPITAKVVYNGKERAMKTPQMSGDCNSCHTEKGTQGAPGRVALPQ